MGDLDGDYAPKYEMVLFCSSGERKLNNGRSPNIIKATRTGNDLHPTQKPVDLMSFLLGKSAAPGDKIFDPFAGSGSTAHAFPASCDLQRTDVLYFFAPLHCQWQPTRL